MSAIKDAFVSASLACKQMADEYKLPYGIPERIEEWLERINDCTSIEEAQELARKILGKMQMHCLRLQCGRGGSSEHLEETAKYEETKAVEAKITGNKEEAQKHKRRARSLKMRAKRA